MTDDIKNKNKPFPSTTNMTHITRAAQNMLRCQRPFMAAVEESDPDNPLYNLPDPTAEMNEMVTALEYALEDDGNCTDLLFSQARVLDGMFARLIAKAMDSPYKNPQTAPTYIDERHLNLALRSQKQCRGTIEALARLRSQEKRNDDG